MENFNAKVGEEKPDHERKEKGPHGLGQRNDTGEQLITA